MRLLGLALLFHLSRHQSLSSAEIVLVGLWSSEREWSKSLFCNHVRNDSAITKISIQRASAFNFLKNISLIGEMKLLVHKCIIRQLTISSVRKFSKDVKEVKIPVPWGHISGKWWGRTDIQPLLGLHGWQDNAGTFDGVAPFLPDHISLFAIDFPGHGLSSWYPSSICYNTMQELLTIRRIVKHMGWERVSLLGHSMGSEIAFLYASVYPEETETLIGLDLAKPVTAKPQRVLQKAGSIVEKVLQMHDINREKSPRYTYSELVERLHKGYKGSLSKDCCEILLKRGKVQLPCGNYYYSRDPRLNASPALLSEYPLSLLMKLASNIKCEVLNLKGKPGKDFENPKYYHETIDILRKSAKRLEFHEVEGTHHFHLSNPRPTADHIINFLSVK
ncbi:probable serine hydrolase [Ischnura elegans]|uniref:probable serine hydrolase n=1 Tax=Ischnura elegans TaxID=197161 RepID=UPI001ED86F80|nr:probable serine hydrolase [Ischnura elegans]